MFMFFSKVIKVLLIFLFIGLLSMSLISIHFLNTSVFFLVVILLLIISILAWLYKKRFVSKTFMNVSLAFLFMFGIIIRIYLIANLQNDLSLLFLQNKFWFSLLINIVCQVLSGYFLYRIINLSYSQETSLFIASLYFLLPVIILSNLLVSLDSILVLLFLISSYLVLRNNHEEINIKNILYYVLLGVLLFLSIKIQPSMIIFLIALVINYLIKFKNIPKFVLLAITLFTILLSNVIIKVDLKKELDSIINLNITETFKNNIQDYSENLEEEVNTKNNLAKIKLKYNVLESGNIYLHYLENDNGIVSPKANNMIYSWGNSSHLIFIIIYILNIIALIKKLPENNKRELFLEIFLFAYIVFNLLAPLDKQFSMLFGVILLINCSYYFENALTPKKITKPYIFLKKMEKKNPKVLLIIPAYNEEDVIKKTVLNVKKHHYDYVVINDGSTDQTEKICVENNFNHITLISNLGIGGAVQAGYKYALKNNYDIAIQFDADGQHDINCVEKLINPIINGEAHFVIGSRFVEGSTSEFKSTKMRQIGIKLISWLINKYALTRIYDTTSGFRAANKEIIKEFANNYPTEYPEPISSFKILKDGYTIKEVPVKMFERAGGKSSIMSWKQAYYMFNVFFSIIIEQLRSEDK